MPVGLTVNSLCLLAGGLVGSRVGKYLPERVRMALMQLFGYCSMMIGITLIPRMSAMPAVMLSLILGTAIGEGIRLEDRISSGLSKAKGVVERATGKTGEADDAFISRFVGVLLLVCTSPTGLIGALTEGMTGERTILLTKSIMDFCSGISFAATLGVMVALIAVPQFLIFIALFFLAGAVMPIVSPAMVGDFTACGGVIVLMTGFRIAEIKPVRASNSLPALVLAMPISALWSTLF